MHHGDPQYQMGRDSSPLVMVTKEKEEELVLVCVSETPPRVLSLLFLFLCYCCGVYRAASASTSASHLSLVEVVDYFAAEPLFAVPLGLGRVVQELLERPLVPVKQLPVQQQREGGLCGRTLSHTCCVCVCVCAHVCVSMCVCCTGVVLSLQMHITQFVDVADVHLLLVDLRLVEVLKHKH